MIGCGINIMSENAISDKYPLSLIPQLTGRRI